MGFIKVTEETKERITMMADVILTGISSSGVTMGTAAAAYCSTSLFMALFNIGSRTRFGTWLNAATSTVTAIICSDMLMTDSVQERIMSRSTEIAEHISDAIFDVTD